MHMRHRCVLARCPATRHSLCPEVDLDRSVVLWAAERAEARDLTAIVAALLRIRRHIRAVRKGAVAGARAHHVHQLLWGPGGDDAAGRGGVALAVALGLLEV